MVETYLKLLMADLEPLSEILKGNSDPSSPRHLTDAARQVLAQWNIQYRISRYIILIIVNLGKHIFCLQNLPL